MKRSSLRFNFILFTVLLPIICCAQSTNGKTALLTPSFKSKLKASKLHIVVPTWIPKGFKIVRAEVVSAKDMFMRDVHLRYEKPGTKSFFFIQFASDGIGDPFFDLPNGDTLEPSGLMSGKNAVIGAFDMEYVTKKPYLMWHTTWYELKKTSYPKYVLVAGENLPIVDGKRIISSLAWLK